jgi:hypothetical protein
MLTTSEKAAITAAKALSARIRKAALARNTVKDLTTRWVLKAPSEVAVQMDALIALVEREAADVLIPNEGGAVVNEPTLGSVEMLAIKGAKRSATMVKA